MANSINSTIILKRNGKNRVNSIWYDINIHKHRIDINNMNEWLFFIVSPIIEYVFRLIKLLRKKLLSLIVSFFMIRCY